MNEERVNDMALNVVVLAAGQGTRMKSKQPKVLHKVAGKAMLERVIDSARILNPKQIVVVYGHQGDLLKAAFEDQALSFVEQTPQRGTADALMKAAPMLAQDERVLILYGDVPLISAQTLQHFIDKTPKDALGIMTVEVEDPTGLGRIIRDAQGNIIKIVEQKDASLQEQALREVNTGIYVVNTSHLNKWLPQIKNDNQQQEYYLTDIVALAAKDKIAIISHAPAQVEEILGVNDRIQLAQLERFYQHKIATDLMRQGVTLADPNRVEVRGTLSCEQDVSIDTNVIFEGQVSVKQGTSIGPQCILKNCQLGENVTILAHCYLEDVTIADNCTIGPFARLRPGTTLGNDVRIGNFVEIKNAQIASGTKINHLSYIGDAIVGKEVNIGAGTITCNYDGVNKHQTIIEDNVMIGSDTQLIAPIRVGAGATIGAGSTVNKDVPKEQLTLTHQLNQRSKKWERPKKVSTSPNQQEKA